MKWKGWANVGGAVILIVILVGLFYAKAKTDERKAEVFRMEHCK